MTNSGRILKSNQLENHEIVLLGSAAAPVAPTTTGPSPEDPVEEALLFTASEVEDLCEKARASGAADAAASLGPAIERLVGTLGQFAHDEELAAARLQQDHAKAVVDTAATIARWVLGRELREPNALLEVVSRALNEPVGASPCRLRIHPDLVALLYEIAPESVELQPDHELEIGEFRVERDGPEVALQFDATLDRATELLVEGEVPR